VILHTVWRWRRVQDPTTIIDFYWAAAKYGPLVDDGPVPTVFKTIWILAMAICLGVTLDMHDLYPPNNEYVPYLLRYGTQSHRSIAIHCLRQQTFSVIAWQQLLARVTSNLV